MALPYKTAKLSNPNPTDCFVYFSYIDPSTGKFKRFKERHGLNNQSTLDQIAKYYKTTSEAVRLKMAMQMIKVIDEELRNGFNPFLQLEYKETGATHTIMQSLDIALIELCKGASKNQVETYRLMHGRLVKHITAS